MNPLFATDSYKLDHRRQYPKGTTRVYSNLTPRMSRDPNINKVCSFGFQFFAQDYLMDRFEKYFFSRSVDEVCTEYQEMLNEYLGPNDIGTDHIRALHNLGYLPLEFKTIPEGSFVPLRVPVLTVENTHDDFFWLPNYFETILSDYLWGPQNSATTASEYRLDLDCFAAITGGAKEFVQWQGHDFSMRGMWLDSAAALSGAAHLLFFTGSDTIPAVQFIKKYYPVPKGYLIGMSVAATEHSVMCAGQQSGEKETFERLIDLYPNGIVSVVSDTWDLWNVLTNILPSIKDKIMARDGKLVIRPDSGDPVKIICGDEEAVYGSPASKGVVQLLWELFGGTITNEGYKQLDTHIGVIYGDSINHERRTAILRGLMYNGFASTNIVLGIGSFTYQYATRDTFGVAMKATNVIINGESINIFKAPITDDGMKNSARGRLAVLRKPLEEDDEPDLIRDLYLIENATPEQEAQSLLTTSWKNGKFIRFEGFDVIRERALLENSNGE